MNLLKVNAQATFCDHSLRVSRGESGESDSPRHWLEACGVTKKVGRGPKPPPKV